MFFKTTTSALFTLLVVNWARGAALPPSDGQVSILIATDPYYACNCPNNCKHKQSSSCKYYGGPSDLDDVIKGSCEYPNGNIHVSLECIA